LDTQSLLARLVAAVERVGHHVEIFRQDFNHQCDAISRSYKNKQKQNREPVREPITVKFTDTEIEGRETAQSEQNSIQRSIRNATRGAVVVAAVYAALTYCMFRTMNNQYNADQRAWVGLVEPRIVAFGNGNPADYLQGGTVDLKLAFTFVNSGKAAARNVKTIIDWKAPEHSFVQPEHCDAIDKSQEISAPWIAPQSKYVLREPMANPMRYEELTHQYWPKQLKTGGNYFCVFGQITYDDSSGHHYTHFSVWSDMNNVSNVGYNEYFNDMN
jgi:hypothetical protein